MPSRVSERQVLRGIISEAIKHGCCIIRLALRPGVTAGWPDLLVLIPGGRPLFLEVKAPDNGRLKELQWQRLNELKELGYSAFAVSSVDDARSLIVLAKKEAAWTH